MRSCPVPSQKTKRRLGEIFDLEYHMLNASQQLEVTSHNSSTCFQPFLLYLEYDRPGEEQFLSYQYPLTMSLNNGDHRRTPATVSPTTPGLLLVPPTVSYETSACILKPSFRTCVTRGIRRETGKPIASPAILASSASSPYVSACSTSHNTKNTSYAWFIGNGDGGVVRLWVGLASATRLAVEATETIPHFQDIDFSHRICLDCFTSTERICKTAFHVNVGIMDRC
jgi:hypothetical protein